MKMGKKEVSLFVVILISVLFIVGGVMLLAEFEQMKSLTGMAAGGIPGPPGGSPPGQGGGGGGGTVTTTTTTTESGGGGGIQKVVGVIARGPENLATLKRGTHLFLTQVYYAGEPSNDATVTAESNLFDKLNFPLRKPLARYSISDDGFYGLNITLGKNVTKGRYKILYKAEQNVQYDEFALLINIDSELRINASLNEKYFKGQNIEISGFMYDFNGTPPEKVNATISASHGEGLIFKKDVSISQNGFFQYIFPISFGEPEGIWDITIEVKDKDGNEGNLSLKTNIVTPTGVAFYTVTFLSPLADGEFKRGSIVPITVEIKDGEKPIENASVDFRTPKAEIAGLREVAPGTYTAEYNIKQDDPLGKWYIAVQAVKTVNNITKAGGTKIPIVIWPAAINLALIEPKKTDFFTGLQTEIKAELSYSDGTKIEKAEVFATIGNETIKLIETGFGEYSAFYLFTEKDAKAASLQLSASDIYGNSVALTPKAIEVEQIGKYELKLRLFYYNILARYWYLFILSVILVILITWPLWHRAYLKRSLKKIIENETRVIEMEKDIQRKYFKHHSITREDYDKLMLKYRERASDLKEKRLLLSKKLGRKEK